jgi:hypothetical protein
MSSPAKTTGKLKKILLASLAVFLMLEASSCVVFYVYDRLYSFAPGSNPDKREIFQRYGVDPDKIFIDHADVYENLVGYHPYRWYSLPAGYKGNYTVLDQGGFRIDRGKVSGSTDKIAFFGGSTMYSISTRQEGSIPALFDGLLDNTKAQALNYGVGGYSSTTEMIAFIEALRQGEKIKYAVFYDGVNEIAMYAEKLQHIGQPGYYDVFGYPFQDVTRKGILNTYRFRTGEPLLKSFLLAEKVIKRIRERFRQDKPGDDSLRVSAENVTEHADRIINIYIHNMKDIKALADACGVVPVFFWQPSIFTCQKAEFSDYEQRMLSEPSLRAIEMLSDEILRRLPAAVELEGVHFYDLSGSLDTLDDRNHFYDWCHISEDANRTVAETMAGHLHGVLPAEYWR